MKILLKDIVKAILALAVFATIDLIAWQAPEYISELVDFSVLESASWVEIVISVILAPAPIYLFVTWLYWPQIIKRYSQREA